MYVFSCKREYEAMLTCIYVAWASGKGSKNIRLELEPVEQYSLFDEYIHVDADNILATKVMDSVNLKISASFYNEIVMVAMSHESDALDIMYRMMLYGFTYGEQALKMVHYPEIIRYASIRKKVGTEILHFQEFTRFHLIKDNLYIAHIEPKSRIITALGPIFQDRMPSENWMIVDDTHREAIVHPKDSLTYLRIFLNEEFENVLRTEEANDEYTDLWKVFFESVAIKERSNERCQNNLFPIWVRKHAVEFL